MSERTLDSPAVPTDEHGKLPYDVFSSNCPSRHAMEHVTGRWGILALAALRDGAVRFNALRRMVCGISEKMLSQTLHALERDGFVDRDARSTIPPRVEYSLTPLGLETADKLIELIQLLEGRMPLIETMQERYDARSRS